ncbi:MAG: hypothetical protein HWN68_15020 [Desulfobacterales bacterium]|nr:hypothetical protein [Desulfobacterales bacterium]
MSEEDKKAEDQSQKGQASDANDKSKEDYEAKYKEQQAKQEKLVEELKSAKDMLDAVTPYVDWEAAQGKKEQSDGSEPEYLDKKTVEEMRRRDRELTENELLELRFEVANPDLKGDIDLVKSKLMSLRVKHPRTDKRKLLEMAADEARKHIQKIKDEALEETKKAQAEKEEKDASGLDAQGTTSSKSEERGQTDEEYFKERSKDLAQKKGQQLVKM